MMRNYRLLKSMRQPKLVNTSKPRTGKPMKCPERPLVSEIHPEFMYGDEELPVRADQEIMLESLIGPVDGFDTGKWLRWYSAPYPDGQKLSPGTDAGSVFGPVLAIMHTEPSGRRPGYVSCMVPNPFFMGDPQRC